MISSRTVENLKILLKLLFLQILVMINSVDNYMIIIF